MSTCSKRISRWSDEGGKAVCLTERDLAIFNLLQLYPVLPSDFIHAFIGGNRQALQNRLKLLHRKPNRYLERPKQQRQYANANYRPLAYTLNRRSMEVLRGVGDLSDHSRAALSRGRTELQREFAHTLMISTIMASIELAVQQRPDLRFISWQAILDKAPEVTRPASQPLKMPVSGVRNGGSAASIMPDGLFGLAYEQEGSTTYRFFAVEADRGTMPITRSSLKHSSYFKKLLLYREVLKAGIYRAHLGIPNFLVLNVTASEERLDKLIAILASMPEDWSWKQALLFRTMPVLGDFAQSPVPAPELLTEQWRRAGFGPFSIDR